MIRRANPFKRTLIIFGVTVVSAIIGFFVIGAQLLSPLRSVMALPDDGFPVRPVQITTPDGDRLSGWLVAPDEVEAIVVLLHPVLADRSSMLERARFLHAAGYAALLLDSRAHGESEGRRITYGLRESRDLLAAVAFAKERFPAAVLVTLGVSLGGGAVLLAEPELEVDGLILEAVLPDLTTALSSRLRLRLGQMGVYLAPFFASQIQWRLNAAAEDFWTFARASAVADPVMVIAASADRRVPSEETLRFYERLESDKSIWLVGGAVHQDLHWYAGAEYERRVLDFVAYVIAGKTRL